MNKNINEGWRSMLRAVLAGEEIPEEPEQAKESPCGQFDKIIRLLDKFVFEKGDANFYMGAELLLTLQHELPQCKSEVALILNVLSRAISYFQGRVTKGNEAEIAKYSAMGDKAIELFQIPAIAEMWEELVGEPVPTAFKDYVRKDYDTSRYVMESQLEGMIYNLVKEEIEEFEPYLPPSQRKWSVPKTQKTLTAALIHKLYKISQKVKIENYSGEGLQEWRFSWYEPQPKWGSWYPFMWSRGKPWEAEDGALKDHDQRQLASWLLGAGGEKFEARNVKITRNDLKKAQKFIGDSYGELTSHHYGRSKLLLNWWKKAYIKRVDDGQALVDPEIDEGEFANVWFAIQVVYDLHKEGFLYKNLVKHVSHLKDSNTFSTIVNSVSDEQKNQFMGKINNSLTFAKLLIKQSDLVNTAFKDPLIKKMIFDFIKQLKNYGVSTITGQQMQSFIASGKGHSTALVREAKTGSIELKLLLEVMEEEILKLQQLKKEMMFVFYEGDNVKHEVKSLNENTDCPTIGRRTLFYAYKVAKGEISSHEAYEKLGKTAGTTGIFASLVGLFGELEGAGALGEFMAGAGGAMGGLVVAAIGGLLLWKRQEQKNQELNSLLKVMCIDPELLDILSSEVEDEFFKSRDFRIQVYGARDSSEPMPDFNEIIKKWLNDRKLTTGKTKISEDSTLTKLRQKKKATEMPQTSRQLAKTKGMPVEDVLKAIENIDKQKEELKGKNIDFNFQILPSSYDRRWAVRASEIKQKEVERLKKERKQQQKHPNELSFMKAYKEWGWRYKEWRAALMQQSHRNSRRIHPGHIPSRHKWDIPLGYVLPIDIAKVEGEVQEWKYKKSALRGKTLPKEQLPKLLVWLLGDKTKPFKVVKNIQLTAESFEKAREKLPEMIPNDVFVAIQIVEALEENKNGLLDYLTYVRSIKTLVSLSNDKKALFLQQARNSLTFAKILQNMASTGLLKYVYQYPKPAELVDLVSRYLEEIKNQGVTTLTTEEIEKFVDDVKQRKKESGILTSPFEPKEVADVEKQLGEEIEKLEELQDKTYKLFSGNVDYTITEATEQATKHLLRKKETPAQTSDRVSKSLETQPELKKYLEKIKSNDQAQKELERVLSAMQAMSEEERKAFLSKELEKFDKGSAEEDIQDIERQVTRDLAAEKGHKEFQGMQKLSEQDWKVIVQIASIFEEGKGKKMMEILSQKIQSPHRSTRAVATVTLGDIVKLYSHSMANKEAEIRLSYNRQSHYGDTRMQDLVHITSEDMRMWEWARAQAVHAWGVDHEERIADWLMNHREEFEPSPEGFVKGGWNDKKLFAMMDIHSELKRLGLDLGSKKFNEIVLAAKKMLAEVPEIMETFPMARQLALQQTNNSLAFSKIIQDAFTKGYFTIISRDEELRKIVKQFIKQMDTHGISSITIPQIQDFVELMKKRSQEEQFPTLMLKFMSALSKLGLAGQTGEKSPLGIIQAKLENLRNFLMDTRSAEKQIKEGAKEQQERQKRVIIIPGGFKPPHKGHVMMINHYLKNYPDAEIVVYSGSKTRKGGDMEFGKEVALQIFDLYKEAGAFIDPSRLRFNFDLTQREKRGGGSWESPFRDAIELAETGDVGVGLGYSEKDAAYGERFAKAGGENAFDPGPAPSFGQMSATDFRNAIANNDEKEIAKFLPHGIDPQSLMGLFTMEEEV